MVPHQTVQTKGGLPIRFEYNVGVEMSDGLGLMVNIFRPDDELPHPVIITHGVYGKDVAWQTAEPYKAAWQKVSKNIPSLANSTSGRFLRWEMPDPELWIPGGYIVIHADSRGSGKTQGFLDRRGPKETQDFKELIEWAAVQPWSNGKVGLSGISYYASNQWQVAALQPKGLAAIIPWEGAHDHYRDATHHGGIPSAHFARRWFERQCLPNQHGNSASTFIDAVTGRAAVGDALPPELLAGNRRSPAEDVELHPLDDAYHGERTPDLRRIEVPVLSVGNWGGVGLHLRGNIEGYSRAASKEKWLRVHTGDHFTPFYEPASFDLQKAFFDRYLKGDASAFADQPPVQLLVRHPQRPSTWRHEKSWPVPGTNFVRLHLNAADRALSHAPIGQSSEASYDALTGGCTFLLPPQAVDAVIIGPLKARIWVRANSEDSDYFVTLRVLDTDGKDVTFEGANAPAVPVTSGWLRLSHRRLDAEMTTEWRPYHSHLERELGTVGETYALEIEIWPTSVVVPEGYSLALTVRGSDFEFPHLREPPYTGVFPFLHSDRDPVVFGNIHTLLTGGDFDSYLQIPLAPAEVENP